MKVTFGTISGCEDVHEFQVLQHTTPISPGNSGGPLCKKIAGPQCVLCGINFAAAVGHGSQSNNYAIPKFRLMQVLEEYNQRALASKEGACTIGGDFTDCEMRVPPVRMVAVMGQPDLYKAVGANQDNVAGCIMSQVHKFGVMSAAGVQNGDVVTHINNVVVDEFCMGKNNEFGTDQATILNLLYMKKSLLSPATVTVLRKGKENKMDVSLRWSDQYDGPIGYIAQPGVAKIDYEFFAGIVFEDCTANAFDLMMSKYDAGMQCENGSPIATYPHFLSEKNTHFSCVMMIDTSEGGSQFCPGTIVDEINGVAVSNMKQFRDNFNKPSTCGEGESTWTVTSISGGFMAVPYDTALMATGKFLTELGTEKEKLEGLTVVQEIRALLQRIVSGQQAFGGETTGEDGAGTEDTTEPAETGEAGEADEAADAASSEEDDEGATKERFNVNLMYRGGITRDDHQLVQHLSKHFNF